MRASVAVAAGMQCSLQGGGQERAANQGVVLCATTAGSRVSVRVEDCFRAGERCRRQQRGGSRQPQARTTGWSSTRTMAAAAKKRKKQRKLKRTSQGRLGLGWTVCRRGAQLNQGLTRAVICLSACLPGHAMGFEAGWGSNRDEYYGLRLLPYCRGDCAATRSSNYYSAAAVEAGRELWQPGVRRHGDVHQSEPARGGSRGVVGAINWFRGYGKLPQAPSDSGPSAGWWMGILCS